MHDTSAFFQEATSKICGSLNIEESLWESIKFLGRYMPADEIYLDIYNPNEGSLRVLAQATPQGGQRINKIIPLTDEVRKLVDLNCSREKMPYDKVLILNRPDKHTVAKFLCSSMNLVQSSILTMFLFIDDSRLGVVDIIAKGNDRFEEEHGRIFSLLQSPFAVAVSNALKHQDLIDLKNSLKDENIFLSKQLQKTQQKNIIGASSGLKQVMNKVHQVAPKDSTVLIFGETGVGKEVIAQAVHSLSKRRNGPFIKVNCGAIPENLVDSELFGHERGAFTGAVHQKKGRFELAHTGTIFLDEIGELPHQAQVRLLHILQHKKTERVGGTRFIDLDIRIIAATHRDLQAMVDAGQFRQDLWFRLNVFPVSIPPLRERKEDIPALTRHIVKMKCQKMGFMEVPRISKECMDELLAYEWPGNIRELENLIERELIQNNGQIDSSANLPPTSHPRPRENSPEPGFASLDENMSEHIQRALAYSQGKIHGPKGAADLLGIHPNTLRYRMKKLGIPFKKKDLCNQ